MYPGNKPIFSRQQEEESAFHGDPVQKLALLWYSAPGNASLFPLAPRESDFPN